ncbi:MAG: DotI/IcmL family type IV secretion protein [Pseudobdellovibrionaceae bacterium]|jgi:hypothetical protein|nr:DotI/IcmL family type IV secretion protein [Pseudobdellovibrionaceae bacterium]
MPAFRIASLSLCAASALTLAVAMPQPAFARSILEVLFGDHTLESVNPNQKTPYDQSKPPLDAQTSELLDMYGKAPKVAGEGSTLDITQPHLSPEEIQSWGSGFISQALSLNISNWAVVHKDIQKDFSAYGYKEYQDYLTRMNVQNLLKNNNMRMQAIADGPAQVLREGLVSGTYHWLVQVPVMTTFYSNDVVKLKSKTDRPGQNQKLLVQIQIGRTAKAGANQHGIEIERWIVLSGK